MPRQYGPVSPLVERFLSRLASVDLEGYVEIVRVWRDTLRQSDDWYEAEDAVGNAIAKTARHDEMWRLQDAIYDLFRGSTWYGRPPHGEPTSPPKRRRSTWSTRRRWRSW